MKILLVEDNQEFSDGLITDCQDLDDSIMFDVGASRDEAKALIDLSEHYDFCVCDLKLPAKPDDGELSVNHGLAVAQAFRRKFPGSPIMYLTGSNDIKGALRRTEEEGSFDLFGTGTKGPLTTFRLKEDYAECVREIPAYAKQLRALDAVPITFAESDQPNQPTGSALRTIRLAARLSGAISAQASILSGLSASTTVMLTLMASNGGNAGNVVVKIGRHAKVLDESERIAGLAATLPAGYYAGVVHNIEANCGAFAAISMSAARDSRSLFGVLEDDASTAAEVIKRLRKGLYQWSQIIRTDPEKIETLRRLSISDQSLESLHAMLQDIPWREYEGTVVRIPYARQHGDLHPANILVDTDLHPLVIDFAKTGNDHPACADAIALEFGLWFHPSSPMRSSFNEELNFDQWLDVDRFARGSRAEEFVRECRRWALEAAQNDVNVVRAVAYGHAVRQLQYPDVDKDRALKLIRGLVQNA